MTDTEQTASTPHHPQPSSVSLDPAAYVDAAAPAIGLVIDPAWRDDVIRYFALASRMAELVNGLELSPHDEPSPVYRP